VGANALGLINRGFDTYVAPSMGNALQDTPCESCGLCITTCPTGAITENVLFKPGPVRLEQAETICNYCSVGCAITLGHKSQFVMQVNGAEGLVNPDGNLCRYAKFGYRYLNDRSRITRPMMKVNGQFETVSWEKAYEVIAQKMSAVAPDENAFFAGARLTNEEMYLVQKLARAGARTNNVTSFHYMARGAGYRRAATAATPFSQIRDAGKIYLVGSEINGDNAVLGFTIYNVQFTKGVPVSMITDKTDSSMAHKADEVMVIRSYYHFIKAVNHYLASAGLHNGLFIKDNCAGYEEFKAALLKESFTELVRMAGVSELDVIDFAKQYNQEQHAVIVFSEKELSSNACTELFNLALLNGKLGKTGSGLIALKEKNNSQGLLDMGICRNYGPGGGTLEHEDLRLKLSDLWKMESFPAMGRPAIIEGLEAGSLKNLFIFGEDPAGCAVDKKRVEHWFAKAGFIVVQDYFMTETAAMADLILPATFPVETGGSFTNTRKVIQEFGAVFTPGVERTNLQQLADLHRAKGIEQSADPGDVMSEIISLLPESKEITHSFVITESDNPNRLFNHGCDDIVRRFDEEFAQAFNHVKVGDYERV
jgi:formate dehydrogenase major subunit